MNHKVILSSVAFVSLSGAAWVQAAAATASVEKDIAAIEEQWSQAQNANNVPLEATLLADAIVLVGFDGKVYNKDQFIAEEKQTKYTKVTAENVVVHAYGTAAVATYVLTIKATDMHGKAVDLRANETDTWLKMPDGKWQCIASVVTHLPK